MATSPIYSWPEPDNTDLVKNGALAIRTLGNAIDTTMGTMVAKTIIDAKGDLIAGTAADTAARLAVGNNGETLVANSSTATGLSYQGNFASGKNKVINGDMTVNQRSFISTTSSDIYGFDRWFAPLNDGTCTYSAQTFTPGAAPVAGYEGANFARIVTTGQTLASARATLNQRIEDVRTFAGQTVTVSFWAKAASGTPSIAIEFAQSFGTGGSPSASVTGIGAVKVAITTSWVRYSSTISIPSLSGKTLGTNANTSSLQLALYASAGTDYNVRTGSLGIQSNTFDYWGVQVETGSVATAFQTATGTIQGELAACQRYYVRLGANSGNNAKIYSNYGNGFVVSAAAGTAGIVLPVTMRTQPSSTVDASNLAIQEFPTAGLKTVTATVLDDNLSSPTLATVTVTVSGATSGVSCRLLNNNNAAGYIGFSAEL
jgi:hypothetical protein